MSNLLVIPDYRPDIVQLMSDYHTSSCQETLLQKLEIFKYHAIIAQSYYKYVESIFHHLTIAPIIIQVTPN